MCVLKKLFGISVDNDASNKPDVSVFRVICYPECRNSPCPLDTSQVSHRTILDKARKDLAQFPLLLTVPIILQ